MSRNVDESKLSEHGIETADAVYLGSTFYILGRIEDIEKRLENTNKYLADASQRIAETERQLETLSWLLLVAVGCRQSHRNTRNG